MKFLLWQVAGVCGKLGPAADPMQTNDNKYYCAEYG